MALSEIIRPGVLVVDYVLLSRDVAREFALHGFSIHWLSPKQLTVAHFEAACLKHHPRFLFSINFSPELAFLCTRYQVPYVSWTVDPLPRQRFNLFPGTDTGCCRVFCHQRSLVDRFRELGFATARFLPIAAADRRFPETDALRMEAQRCPISFVGQSLTDEKIQAQTALMDAGASRDLLDEVGNRLQKLARGEADTPGFSGLAGRPDLIPTALGIGTAFEELGLDQMTDLLDGWLAHEIRTNRVQALASHGLHTYGDEGWRTIAANYRGYANHYEQLNLIYSASAINLDLPRVYQRDIITMRVFDVLACGGILLSEWQADLAEWFIPGEHLFLYHSTNDLVNLVSLIHAMPPRDRQEIGRAAQKEVFNRHRLAYRIEEMLKE